MPRPHTGGGSSICSLEDFRGNVRWCTLLAFVFYGWSGIRQSARDDVGSRMGMSALTDVCVCTPPRKCGSAGTHESSKQHSLPDYSDETTTRVRALHQVCARQKVNVLRQGNENGRYSRRVRALSPSRRTRLVSEKKSGKPRPTRLSGEMQVVETAVRHVFPPGVSLSIKC